MRSELLRRFEQRRTFAAHGVRDVSAVARRSKADLLRCSSRCRRQHAKLDTLLLQELAADCSPEQITRAVDGYLAIGAFLDNGLAQQVELDLDALERASGRKLRDA